MSPYIYHGFTTKIGIIDLWTLFLRKKLLTMVNIGQIGAQMAQGPMGFHGPIGPTGPWAQWPWAPCRAHGALSGPC